MFSYDRFLPASANREMLRRQFGLRDDQFAFLVFGAIRNRDELQLLRKAYQQVHGRHFSLIMAGRYHPDGGAVTRRMRLAHWKLWLRRFRVASNFGFVPDSEIYRYFVAADAVVIPRIDQLSSGIVGLGATFGRLMIAPNTGAFPDYLRGTDNLLYGAGDASSLANQMQQAPRIEGELIQRQNRKLAEDWTWTKIAATCLASVNLE